MNRRDVIRSLAGTGAAVSFNGCRYTPARPSALTDADVEQWTLMMTGVELKPGQAAPVREMLATMRFKGKVDPTVQSSLVFDPEVDVE